MSEPHDFRAIGVGYQAQVDEAAAAGMDFTKGSILPKSRGIGFLSFDLKLAKAAKGRSSVIEPGQRPVPVLIAAVWARPL